MKSAPMHVAACAVTIAAAALAGCSGSVSAPTSYDNYNAKDGSFACKYPAGWEAKGGGRGGFHSASFSQGAAKIKVSADLAGSLLGDIAKSGMAGMMPAGEVGLAEEDLEEFSPVAQVHQMGQEEMADEFGDYQEQASEAVDTELGKGRLSEFSASTGFGGKLRGYRLTVLAHDRRVTVVCYVPEKNWAVLEPAFSEVIGSLKRGKEEL